MGTGYVRQSAADIITGATVEAAPLNLEFNQLRDAFHMTTGHGHDGTTGEGPKIDLTTSITGVLPAVNGGFGGLHKTDATTAPTANDDSGDGYNVGSFWIDITNNKAYMCVDATLAGAIWVYVGVYTSTGSGNSAWQPIDTTLTAFAAYNTNGLITQTAADTFVGRTITGTANQVVVTNGDGVSGNPTLSLPQSIATSSSPQFATIELGAASDTTLARSSAGVISVEGKNVYMAGGTDVAVADGGTNISSYTVGDILYASGATTLSKLAIGTAGQGLRVNSGATAPEWFTRPMFQAHKNGTDQTNFAPNTQVKVTWGTEAFDIGSYFTSNGWTPPSGKVEIRAQCYLLPTNAVVGDQIIVSIYKNGTAIKRATNVWHTTASGLSTAVACIDDANGSDVYEVYVYSGFSGASNRTVFGDSKDTYFEGKVL